VVLEITEKGAHAAAATAAGIERFGEIGEFFEINRPFLFFIWDYHSGALLFIGRVSMPQPIPI
jgi:serine protease inhibitor